MPEVIISARDTQKISQISSQLPHALLVIADYGLDGLGVAKMLAKNPPKCLWGRRISQ